MRNFDAQSRRSLPVIAIVLTTCVISGQAKAGPWEDAVAAHLRGDDEETLRLIQPLAEQGHAEAQGLLGYFYNRGIVVPVDKERAVHYYRLAAEQGNPPAQSNLCSSYMEGDGVRRDTKEAVLWCIMAAKQNDAGGHFNMSIAYYDGDGIPQDKVRTYMHLKLAIMHAKHQSMKDLASHNLAFVLRELSAEQIEKGDRLAAAWPNELP